MGAYLHIGSRNIQHVTTLHSSLNHIIRNFVPTCQDLGCGCMGTILEILIGKLLGIT